MPRKNREDWPAHFKVFEIICPECGETCWANKTTAVYCCTTCRVHAWKKRNNQKPDFVSKTEEDRFHSIIPQATVHRNERSRTEMEGDYFELVVPHPAYGAKLEEIAINYARINSQGQIISKIYSSIDPYISSTEVPVMFGNQIIHIPSHQLTEHFTWMKRRHEKR